MKLWTIQTIGFYEKLLRKGKISGQKELVEPCFIFAYDWMIDKMEAAIGKKPSSDFYPIWAWYQYKNAEKRRPDLRCSGHLPSGTKGVRLEIELDENDVLLSDFDLWHYPLNNWKIHDSEEESSGFDHLLKYNNVKFMDKGIYSDEIKKKVEESWDKILDMDYAPDYSAQHFKSKSIQATFWTLSTNEITKVEKFIAR